MGALKDVTGAVMPYALLAGVVAVIYLKRDALWRWFKGAFVPVFLTTDTNGDNINDAGTGVIDPDKPLWEGSLISINPFTGKPWGYTEPPTEGDTNIPWYLQPNQSPSIPAFVDVPTMRDPVTSPGYEEALAGTSNLVIGSADEAYANAQAIRAQYQKPALTTYADLQKFNTNKYYLEHANGGMAYDLKVNESLGLIISGPEPTGYDKSFGWSVMRLTDNPDTPMDERGTIVTGVSGGTNPFGTAHFAPWFKQAITYENSLLGGV